MKSIHSVGDAKAQAVEGRVGVRALTPFLLQNFTAQRVQVCELTAAERAEFAKAAPAAHEKFLAGDGKSAAPIYKKIQDALAAYRAKKK